MRAHSMKANTTLVSAGQIKRLINTNKRYMLMVVRAKDVEASDVFKGCDPSHKKDMIDIVANYDEIFQEPTGLPPKREIQHDAHLPNVGMYRFFTVEMAEIKK